MIGAVQEDKRIRRTKKLLRQALTRLMQQKDFQSITVTDVVREADINRGTFYAHYRDVYDLRDKIEAGDDRGFPRADRGHPHPSGTGNRSSRCWQRVGWIIWRRTARSSRALVRGHGARMASGAKMIGGARGVPAWSCVPFRSVEDAYAARFLATGVVGMTEKWITEPQPIPKNEIVELINRVLTGNLI